MLAVVLGLSGCGTVELFGEYDLPEGADVAEAPWPRLIDVPSAPPVGTYTAEVPNPADGERAQADLAAAAVVADIRRQDLAEPVITEAERNRMMRRAARRQR